ncbi:MAG: carotenoid oxygenase [Rhizobiales bacterium NRL2]|jgi:carotenoid cleavage dioxygenase|nr:MAG: carotenoid oxygenase [Rhizobiales bacterium NRL2]
MTAPFPDHPQLSGNYAPLLMEADAPDLVVRGAIPPELDGTLFRIGPNPQYPPRDRQHHWFAGDGMVHAFRIRDGRVGWSNRWVRTPKFELERAAGEALFGTFGNPLTSADEARGKDSGLANTNIVWHGGRLLALEEAHPPFEMNPADLASKGYFDFDGGLTGGRMTAHPKIDPATGEMLFFGYSVGGYFTDRLSYHVVDAGGNVTQAAAFDAPYAAMIHDFIVTEGHVVFPVLPLTGSLERAMAGRPPFAWEPDKPGWLGVLKRGQHPEMTHWIEIPPCYVFHPMNAFEREGRIVADVMKYDAAPLFPHADGTPGDPATATARLVRWTIDPAHDEVKEQVLDDRPGEFPRFDERRAGLGYRHGWFAAVEQRRKGDRGNWTEIVHADLESGRRTVFSDGEAHHVSEPVFVPRAPDAAEGDGWVLFNVYRAEQNRSDLVILNARDVDGEPVAVAEIPCRVPHGFHGNWVPGV